MRENVSTGNPGLIDTIDCAVGAASVSEITSRIADGLQSLVGRGEIRLPASLTRVTPGSYARRLFHRCPRTGYTVVVMTWGAGQRTGLHDHAGIWCVECVYKGRIEVTSYSVRGGDPEEGLVLFEREEVVQAGVGEAGHLIPPFEYHKIANPHDVPAVTVHVYGGEMTHCHVFTPVEGGYKREFKELGYTD